MSTIDKQALRAAEHIKKSRSKKRALPSNSKDPAAKKKTVRSSRMLPHEEETDLPVIGKCLGCTTFYCPLTGMSGLYSALTMEPSYFYTYPIVLEAPEAKGKFKTQTPRTLSGVTKPELVFTVLHTAFAEIYPKLDPQRIADWEVYRWNVTYYGQGIVARAPTWTELQDKLLEHRPLGGSRLPTHVNVLNEVGTSKAQKAINMSGVFSRDAAASCFPRQHLLDIREKAFEMADSESLPVDKNELEKRLSSMEEESSSESEEDNESDEE